MAIYYVNSVNSVGAIFHKECKSDLELELQENAFWRVETRYVSKTEFKKNVLIL